MSDKNLNSLEAFDPTLRPGIERSLDAMDQLDAITKNSNATMTEGEFRDKFLPYFIDDSKKEEAVSVWWSRVGNPFMGIDVINASTNELLFKVPPLMRTHADKSVDTGGMLISDIITTAAKKAENIPNMGIRHLNQYLTSKVKPIQALDDLRQWNAILVKYGHAPIDGMDELEVAQATESVSGKKEETFREDEYEDL